MRRLNGLNELNDAAIATFAKTKKVAEVAAALALLNNGMPIDMMLRLLGGLRADLLLIPCKAAGTRWTRQP